MRPISELLRSFTVLEEPDSTTLISVCITNSLLEIAKIISALNPAESNNKKEIANDILDRKEEYFPLLARLATTQEYWQDNSVNAWLPISAIHLLVKMRHYRAQLAINSALLEYSDYIGDWLTEDMPYVLAHMGPGAISMLTALMRHGDAYMFVRGMMADALVMIIRDHPETKPGIVASIMDAAQKEPDIKVRTLLVDSLVDLLDPDLYKYLTSSLKTGFTKPTIFNVGDIDRIYARRKPTRGLARDPMYIFEPDYQLRCMYFGSFD